jgi:hypothetical protein
MGTIFLEVVCNEHRSGGDGEYCDGNDAQLDRANVILARHTNKLRYVLW